MNATFLLFFGDVVGRSLLSEAAMLRNLALMAYDVLKKCYFETKR